MKQPPLAHLSTDELVDLFRQNAVEQNRAMFKEEVSKFKMIFGESDLINAELKKRGPDALRALRRLYDDPNMQVRLQAARLTVDVAPPEAKRSRKHCAVWPCASIS